MQKEDHAGTTSVLEYYKKSNPLSDIKRYSDKIQVRPNDVGALVKFTQNIIIHDMWLERYGVKLSPDRVCQQSTPSMEDILELALQLKPGPFSMERSPSEKVIACCREYTTLLCALLRMMDIPARARCGFATYLAKDGYYEDHWICEFWNGTRWQMIDPQIDDFQLNSIRTYANTNKDVRSGYREMLLSLDPMDLKENDFISSAKAWRECRNQQANPITFGISADPKMYKLKSLYGMWFIRGNLLRDFAALNKVELLPFLSGLERNNDYWSSWRLISMKDEELTSYDWELMDHIAVMIANPDQYFEEIMETYQKHEDLRPTNAIIGL